MCLIELRHVVGVPDVETRNNNFIPDSFKYATLL